MQANDGLSLDAQRHAIQAYCTMNGLRLIRIYQDVESGGKANRVGLAQALATETDVVVVLKFDRFSRSIKHFCEMYEQHFADGSRELVAIRESIRLDSALGRALVSILLVFAQMEREAMGERTREAIAHIHRQGYFFGKVPYGYEAVPAPDNPRYRVLVGNRPVLRILRADRVGDKLCGGGEQCQDERTRDGSGGRAGVEADWVQWSYRG
jgi:DNA invertase Pin-like site-specific DNA recombinase